MISVVELLNIERIVFEFDYCTFIVILITVIWCWKYGNYLWKTFAFPIKHFISL